MKVMEWILLRHRGNKITLRITRKFRLFHSKNTGDQHSMRNSARFYVQDWKLTSEVPPRSPSGPGGKRWVVGGDKPLLLRLEDLRQRIHLKIPTIFAPSLADHASASPVEHAFLGVGGDHFFALTNPEDSVRPQSETENVLSGKSGIVDRAPPSAFYSSGHK
ncbi:hypothetical protein HNY73_023182 [Argiope bruennichi]|uniref:Uncharacterized protein n=1 Tax=Argiope bruennichi TaxID=94029 RepID=A0A8T0E7K6_ARGBR|nr:hypothetical protein HNY73_023182 [Argiope bruennichi]